MLLFHPGQDGIQHLRVDLQHFGEARNTHFPFGKQKPVDQVDDQAGRDSQLFYLARRG